MATFVVLAAMCAIQITGSAAAFEYARLPGQPTEPWRAVTGHLSHWSLSHFAWNALGIAVLGGICELRSRCAFLRVGAATALVLGLWLLFGHHDFMHYRGMSGIVSAYFGWLTIDGIREQWQKRAYVRALLTGISALAFAARCAVAWLSGEMLLASPDHASVTASPMAHALGLAAGAWLALRFPAGVTAATPRASPIATLPACGSCSSSA